MQIKLFMTEQDYEDIVSSILTAGCIFIKPISTGIGSFVCSFFNVWVKRNARRVQASIFKASKRPFHPIQAPLWARVKRAGRGLGTSSIRHYAFFEVDAQPIRPVIHVFDHHAVATLLIGH